VVVENSGPGVDAGVESTVVEKLLKCFCVKVRGQTVVDRAVVAVTTATF
jgi:hypothetical protein